MKGLRYLFLIIFTMSVFSLMARKTDSLSVGRLEFVKNVRQWSEPVRFAARMQSGSFFLENDGFTVAMLCPEDLVTFHQHKFNADRTALASLRASAYRVSFQNCNKDVILNAYGEYEHTYNYFLSPETSRWASRVPVYNSVVYENLYPGISVCLRQSGDNLKYDVMLEPYADPSLFCMEFEGVKSISLVHGSLWIDNYYTRVVEMAPVAFQIMEQDTVYVPCSFQLQGRTVSFLLGDYRKDIPLIIDPVVVFSTFSGSVADNWGYTATYDENGYAYGGGIAFGVGYPATLGAYQVDFCTGQGGVSTDVAISKFNASGTSLLYATYLGGSWVDIPHSMFVNSNGELYLFGTTGSSDFPVTANAFNNIFRGGDSVTLSTSLTFPRGSDIFVCRFSADGSQLLSSSLVGGSGNDGLNTAATLRHNYADDNRGEILLDDNSNVYVVTSTSSFDFPATDNAFRQVPYGAQDACVFKMSYDLSQMIWCSYFGGSGQDAGYSMMLSSAGGVYICGGTTSPNLPTQTSAVQPQYATGTDGFVAHFSPNGAALPHCSYLGRVGYDQAYLIKGDRGGFPHILGQTEATEMSWVQQANYFVPNGGQFLIKLDSALQQVVWSTAFGTGNGGPDISPTALLVDYCRNIYLSGWGSHALNGFGGTAGLPITADAFQSTTDGSDYYFLCLNHDAEDIVYGSYFGGDATQAREHVDGGTSRFDKKGRIYQAVCAGCGGQSTFPTTSGAYAQVNGSTNCNLGVIKMDFELPVVVADFELPDVVCNPDTVFFVNHSQTVGNNTMFYWNFGDGATSTNPNPSHSYAHNGVFQITLVVQDVGSCNFADTLMKSLLVLSNSADTLPTRTICAGDFVQIGLPPAPSVDYLWTPAQSLSNNHISNPVASPTQSVLYTLYATTSGCRDTLRQQVDVHSLNVDLMPDTTVCLGDSAFVHITVEEPAGKSVEWSLSPDFDSVLYLDQYAFGVQLEADTTFYVRVRGSVCEFLGAVTVHVSNMQILDAPEVRICFEDELTLSVSHTGGAGCDYHWVLGDGTEFFTERPSVSPAASTTYSVTVTNAFGCTATADGHIIRRVGTFPEPLAAWGAPNAIIPGEQATLFATDYGPDYSYSWQPSQDLQEPDAPSTIASPVFTTLFTISVTDTFACTMQDTVTIKVEAITCDDPFIFVPNVFTPNGDNLNDVLYVRSAVLERFYFVVYNRWGEKMFESENLEHGWDGTFKGEPCQNGVYDYYLKCTCVDGQQQELKGSVTLIR